MLAAYCGGSVDFVRDMHPDTILPITMDVRGKAALSSRMNMPAKAVAEDMGRYSDSLGESQYMYWSVVVKDLNIKAGPSFNADPQIANMCCHIATSSMPRVLPSVCSAQWDVVVRIHCLD